MTTRVLTAPYFAVTDRAVYPKPALPTLGPAGSVIADPVFGSSIRRVTDGATRSDKANVSYRTPSSPHSNAWSSDGKYFWVTSTDGTIVLFAFDPVTGVCAKAPHQPASYIEPQFSFVAPGALIVARNADAHTLETFDCTTGLYAPLVDLTAVGTGVGSLTGTYIGVVASSAAPERVAVLFGGPQQDEHPLVALYGTSPLALFVLDVRANTINGAPTSLPLTLTGLHHVAIDRSGRYVMLYTSAADQSSARKAPQSFLWDLSTGQMTALDGATFPYGHDSFGYGVSVNQDNSGRVPYDYLQWQFRTLSAPTVTRDVVAVPLTPKEVNAEDHSTWNNASPSALLPFVSAVFRYGATLPAWRPLDDEILAIETDAPGKDPTIWRFAHHRSDVSYDGTPANVSFWYEPRPNISHDGGWVLFTSNWEKTLGTDAGGDSGAKARQDVFLVQLATAPVGDPTPVPAPVPTPTPVPLPTLASVITLLQQALKDVQAIHKSGVK